MITFVNGIFYFFVHYSTCIRDISYWWLSYLSYLLGKSSCAFENCPLPSLSISINWIDNLLGLYWDINWKYTFVYQAAKVKSILCHNLCTMMDNVNSHDEIINKYWLILFTVSKFLWGPVVCNCLDNHGNHPIFILLFYTTWRCPISYCMVSVSLEVVCWYTCMYRYYRYMQLITHSEFTGVQSYLVGTGNTCS